MIRVAWYAAVVTATIVVLVLLWQFGAAIVMFLVSLAIAAALRPLIHKFNSTKVPRIVGLGIVYAILIGGIILSWVLITPPLIRDVQQAVNDFLTGYEQAKTNWPQRGTVFQKMLAEQLPPADEFYDSFTTEEGFNALEGVFGFASGLFSFLSFLIISIVVSIYWSADQFRFERLGLSMLSDEQHPKALNAWRRLETGVGAFIRSEVAQSLVTLLVLWLGYAGLGLKYPVLLAIWVAVARLIPWFGVIVALAPTALIWMGISPAIGFIYALFTLSVLILIRRTIQPRIFQMPDYNALPILLLILGFAEGFGLIGILLAPLVGLTIRILLEELNPVPTSRFSPEIIRKNTELLNRIAALKLRMKASSAPAAAGFINRLQSLARSTRDYLRGY